MEIKTIKTENKLKEVFNFMSKLFYDEAKEYNEHYYTMSERYIEMQEQFKKDNELLLYMEEDGRVIAALTSKNMNLEKNKITLGVMAVSKDHRRKGYGKALVLEFEKRCIEKGIKHIDLGARYRACPLYISLGYKPLLMVQVFDFATIEDVKKANKLKLKSAFEWQGDAYGFIFFKVENVKEEYIKYFEAKVENSQAQYIFEKNLG
jgi:GNAT superfamily N-acetyltransferase